MQNRSGTRRVWEGALPPQAFGGGTTAAVTVMESTRVALQHMSACCRLNAARFMAAVGLPVAVMMVVMVAAADRRVCVCTVQRAYIPLPVCVCVCV